MAARMNNNPEAFTTVGDAGGNDSFLEMQKYFGPMSRSDIETHAADKFAHTTHNLPRSYVGRNLFLQVRTCFQLHALCQSCADTLAAFLFACHNRARLIFC